MRVCFGDHLVADNVEHRAAREGKCKGQDRARDAHSEVAYERTEHLYYSRQRGNKKGPFSAHSRGYHRRDDHHTLGDILQSDTARNSQRVGHVIRAEADARGDTLGEIVYSYRDNEEQHLIDLCSLIGVRLLIHSRHLVQVRHELVYKIETKGSAEHSRHGYEYREFVSSLKRGNDKSHHRRAEHYSRRKRKNNIIEFMGRLLEQKAEYRADERGSANSKRSKQYLIHTPSPFVLA